ncbi:MAG: hypothetical protein PHC66_01830 [Candidatus Nanoarchaeia archaeon]|nr:hypothetical protein [Candidatus Nanoarchaeia archaeon]MDD5239027.1 hypothetical protein [Candidatus Nanoarchaeia archaeon]
MRFQMSVSKEMASALNCEQKERMLGSLQETMRSIIADYFMIKRMQSQESAPKKIKKQKEEKLEIIHNPLVV